MTTRSVSTDWARCSATAVILPLCHLRLQVDPSASSAAPVVDGPGGVVPPRPRAAIGSGRARGIPVSAGDDFWSSFTHDPRDPENAALRASDADREIVHRLLADAYADGRLDGTELDTRTELTTGARILGELPPVVRDLVTSRPPPPPSLWPPSRSLASATPEELRVRAVEAYRSDRREALLGMLVPSIICVVIWLVTSGPHGFPWPAFVVAGTGLRLLRTLVRRPDLVEAHLRRLEKQQARELGPGRGGAPG